MTRKSEYKCKHIKDCVYRRPFRLDKKTTSCDYILLEGCSRGCDPKNCDKYIRRDSNEGKEILKKVRSSYYLDFSNYNHVSPIHN
jgi:hypothetical protein